MPRQWYRQDNQRFLGGVNFGRSAPSPDLSGRSPPLSLTGLAMFPCFCVGTPFILPSSSNTTFSIAFVSIDALHVFRRHLQCITDGVGGYPIRLSNKPLVLLKGFVS